MSAKLRGFWQVTWLVFFLTACGGGPPPSNLPPSASDLDVLGTFRLCETKGMLAQRLQHRQIHRSSWGTGEVFNIEAGASGTPIEWLFFDEDDILVGTVFSYPHGLKLEPYPILRDTLSQLPRDREFFLNSSYLLQGTKPETVVLYRTGDKTSTTQYIVRQTNDDYGNLLVMVVVIDPYESLLDGTQPQFLVQRVRAEPPPALETTTETETGHTNTFMADQQFARGEAALFKSCGVEENDIAIDAYSQAIQLGLPDSNRKAEAYFKLGSALRNKGRLVEAQAKLEQALTIKPHAPHILNSLGTVFVQLGKPAQAIAVFEQAIAYKPNYYLARFNLAESYETLDMRRAIEEYETYLALVEGIPQETHRAALVREKLRKLGR